MNSWTINQSRKLYNIEHWGAPYFDINTQGHVTVSPDGSQKKTIDLFQLTQDIKDTGLGFPILIRITNILQDRVHTLHQAFESAKTTYDYQGCYHPVYPIKVNQQRTVVKHILEKADFGVGLEVGSKPELMIALSHQVHEQHQIICNGYKDKKYIRLALIGQALGHQVFIIIEKLSELDLIFQEAKKLSIAPQLGVRIKLSSVGKGKWQNSGGEKSKFGLSASQTLNLIQTLEKNNATHFLTLIHCHLGSQLANIRDIQMGLKEIARYYVELRKLKLPIEYIDVGGGLGVDYEGSQSRNYCSMNYNIQEYANDIVQTFKQVCTEMNLPHPNIITESGRAMAAHHAILVSNIIDHEPALGVDPVSSPTNNSPAILTNLREIEQSISKRSIIEAYHDASYWLSETQTMYTHGIIDLSQRATAETLYFKICRKIQSYLNHDNRAHREIMDELNEKLSDKYFCNFSIFQSLPDIWGIDQIFPIMPLHRLDEAPTKRITLQDITCDSDGTVSHYVENESTETSLPAHALRTNEPYIMGFFLVGAYQEILGDMHNLFGDTHAIDVAIDDHGNYQLMDAEPGDTIEEILSVVHYNSKQLLKNYQEKMQYSQLSQHEKNIYFEELKSSLSDYSYLEH